MSSWKFSVSLLICKNGYKNSLFSIFTMAVDFTLSEKRSIYAL